MASALNSCKNWLAVPHEQLYNDLRNGAGRDGIESASSFHCQLMCEFREATNDLYKALEDLKVTWEGGAANAASAAIGALGPWTDNAFETASSSFSNAYGQGTNFMVAQRKMPEPKKVVSGEDWAPVKGLKNLFGVKTDRQNEEAAANSAHQEAAQVMQEYARAASANYNKFPKYSEPPQVTVEMPDAGASQTPVGGPGAPVRFPRGGQSGGITKGQQPGGSSGGGGGGSGPGGNGSGGEVPGEPPRIEPPAGGPNPPGHGPGPIDPPRPIDPPGSRPPVQPVPPPGLQPPGMQPPPWVGNEVPVKDPVLAGYQDVPTQSPSTPPGDGPRGGGGSGPGIGGGPSTGFGGGFVGGYGGSGSGSSPGVGGGPGANSGGPGRGGSTGVGANAAAANARGGVGGAGRPGAAGGSLMQPAVGGTRREEDSEHKRKYVVDEDDLFGGDDLRVAPAVIGDDSAEEHR